MFLLDKKGICHVVGAGEFCIRFFHPSAEDLVIAADAGYLHLQKLGWEPDMVLGDFDSLQNIPSHPCVVLLPTEKDDTDMLHAVKIGLEKGFRRFALHGALGGSRFDHSLANLQTLLYLTHHGANGFLFGNDGTVITALHNGSLQLSDHNRGVLSVFCMGDRAEGVRLSGLKYPLENHTLTCDMPLGVSNEFIGKTAEISVKDGTLLLIWNDSEFKI